MQFTDSQAEAIDADTGNMLVLACAGSGKTEVIAQRIVALLARPDVEPRHIVAFTFTEKAYGLAERVHRRIKDRYGEMHGLAEMFIGTIHGYALDLLHSQAPEAFKFNVLNDPQARLIIDRYSAKSGLTATTKSVRECGSRCAAGCTHASTSRSCPSCGRTTWTDACCARTSRRRWRRTRRSSTSATTSTTPRSWRGPSTTWRTTRACLQAPSSSTSGRTSGTSSWTSTRTSPVQERLIRGLTQYGADLCVVGDDDQTIYQWRGSAVANILTFENRYADVKRITLNDNFRSSPAITQLARAAIEEIPASVRLAKAMVAGGHQKFERGDLLALEFGDPQEEARRIADRIETLLGVPFQDDADGPERGLSYADFAVLFRSVRGDAGPLVEEFRRRGIPYIIKGLTQLFETPEVRAAVTCFRYVAWLRGRRHRPRRLACRRRRLRRPRARPRPRGPRRGHRLGRLASLGLDHPAGRVPPLPR